MSGLRPGVAGARVRQCQDAVVLAPILGASLRAASLRAASLRATRCDAWLDRRIVAALGAAGGGDAKVGAARADRAAALAAAGQGSAAALAAACQGSAGGTARKGEAAARAPSAGKV